MEITKSLLDEINKELQKENIGHRERPWKALARISEKLKTSISMPSKESDLIFDYFEKHGKPGSQEQGDFHKSIYYYDSEFWLVSIPLIYGTVQINALEALKEMPESIIKSLTQDKQNYWLYIFYWADCIDFGYGYDDLYVNKEYDSFGIQLLHAGYEELSSASSLILENPPNRRAIINARMATEMLLKSYICFKKGLSESEAKKLGHNLNEAFNQFIKCSGHMHLKKIKKLLEVFPKIHERYSQQTASNQEIFDAFSFAQSIGAILVREFTDRNTIEQIKPLTKSCT